ncbi:unnamed protein product [Thelazia callipaeda]|uniref:NTF2 domain-containing protein n=1 Tax=Thelazia callipaeda TaxID=103827 RepID=A0A0N5CNQ8_THECL|nr:unnamed protein product [Thelazia callipaeda]
MEGVGEIVSGHADEAVKASQPSPKEIGREFVRQYYTMLSERPCDVFRFYSHESYFIHDTEQPVQGQEKIQKAIERLAFVDCKARIYTVSGTATLNNGLVIQVCGELSIGNNPGRRFLQTFILCPQTPKKYYVHNNVFQWLDRAFGDSCTQSEKQDVETQMASEAKTLTNGETSIVDGLIDVEPTFENIIETVEQSSNNSEKEQNVELTSESTESVTHAVDHQYNNITSSKSNDSVAEETQTQNFNPAAIDSTPKTWAKLVGSSQTSTTAAATHVHNMNQVPSQVRLHVVPRDNEISVQSNSVIHRDDNDDYVRLHVGGISRNMIPENTLVVEADIRFEFEKYGPVAAVNVPRRALDADLQRTIFAFVIMKNAEGAKNAFSAARKERSLFFIHLKIDSIGFDGEAVLSEQRSGQVNSRTPFIHRGTSRNGFGLRNGSGGGRGGGGNRGLRHVGNEYR